MNSKLHPAALAILSCIVLSGCVAGSGVVNADPNGQQIEVHTILDHREVAGVGCLLANDLGRWFVVAPGRVRITRSSKPLSVDCKRDGVGSAGESWDAQYQSSRLVGNILSNTGLRDYVGNYAYAPTLTVTMRPARPGEPDPGTPVF